MLLKFGKQKLPAKVEDIYDDKNLWVQYYAKNNDGTWSIETARYSAKFADFIKHIKQVRSVTATKRTVDVGCTFEGM